MLNPIQRLSNLYPLLLPTVLGICAFLIVIGPQVLSVQNENWLLSGGDGLQHYLGWIFFRDGPWTFPIGLNPNYDMGINNSIVFTDSIPLLAIIGKLLGPFLPTPFQYFGLYILATFIFQAIFAWKIIRLFSKGQYLAMFGAALIVFAQPFLVLLPENPPIASHFLILAALYLNLKKAYHFPALAWGFLIALSLLIHFYLFAIVLILWASHVADSFLIYKNLSLALLIKNSASIFIAILILAWQVGYFSIDSASEAGYGLFKINLLGLFNPDGWSYLIQNLYPHLNWWGEQHTYLGLGGVVLFFITLWHGKKSVYYLKTLMPQYIFLIFTLILLSLFSISNNIGIGSLELHFYLPESFIKLANILRNSSRMFYPSFYLILFFSIYILQKVYSQKWALRILGICVVAQIIDLSAGWLAIRSITTSEQQTRYSSFPLSNPFWNWAVENYRQIIVIPSRIKAPDFMARILSENWKVFGLLAARNHLSTNAVYLARYNEKKLAQYYLDLSTLEDTNQFKPDVLYIIDKDDVGSVACALTDDQSTLFAKIDDFYVLAPRFLTLKPTIENGKTLSMIYVASLTSAPTINTPIVFTPPQDTKDPFILCSGWHQRENWGVWSAARKARLVLRLPAYLPSSLPSNLLTKSPKTLELNLRALISPTHPAQTMTLSIDSGPYERITLRQTSNNKLLIPITAQQLKKGLLILDLQFDNPISPIAAGYNNGDSRALSVGLQSATFK